MKILKAIFNFYLNSSIHVAVAVCSLLYLTVFEYDLQLSSSLLGFVFFGTISGYNFVKYAGVARFHHRSLTKSLRVIQIFSLISFALLVYFLIQLPPILYVLAGILAVITFLYATPILGKRTLRKLSGFKIFAVAAVWAGITVLFPWYAVQDMVTDDVWLTFVQRFLIVIVLTIPFEIRDLRFDETALGTLPQKLGVNTSKWLGVVVMYAGFSLDLFKDEFSCAHSSAFAITCFLCALALWGARERQGRYYSSFVVEGIPLLWVGLFYVLKYYFEISC
ncbi:hypothetical protein J1N09_09935 [Aureitalea sp. L0-47]|uniref:hypothetical protein n=1 Tax=Aureitalea sp. L0-47 TaxID=2816962 RepID=UPI0022388328|nr:hypothetical protein [Aureitalea sp. L0-47]MCW5520159.1 hypothetical protein [Aureitalea sp. L0-47]